MYNNIILRAIHFNFLKGMLTTRQANKYICAIVLKKILKYLYFSSSDLLVFIYYIL